LSLSNLAIPFVVWKAVGRIAAELASRSVGVVLAMGGYVTVPAGLAARRKMIPLFIAEQNAEAGLANRLMARWAQSVFGSFPQTERLPGARWVGNPIRESLAEFDRDKLKTAALERYHLGNHPPVVGVFGGSLGAGVVNQAMVDVLDGWQGPPIQVLHLTGRAQQEELARHAEGSALSWTVVGHEAEMKWFYAAADLVISRAGGSVAELTATSTPAILIPGRFGSGAHQVANGRALQSAGAAVVLEETEIHRLGSVVAELAADPERRAQMAAASSSIARPRAAEAIAAELEKAHG
jgi:UDP-N-acetylglucosamine--N-acetylmuramyl-(pentapeptide) pyrophosphoryl-undecaprenol N-acetylglucosamine transferase